MSANVKRTLVWSAIATLLIAGLVFAFAPRAVPVDLVTVQKGALVVTVDEEGMTRIHDVFVMSAPVAGRAQRIRANVGDVVVAGETVLVQIEPGDPSFLDPRGEAQAQADVQTARSAAAFARAEVQQASAELEFARAERARAHELIADGTISRRALDDAERLYKTARAVLDTARARLQMRQFELKRAEAQLLSPVQTQGPKPACDCIPLTAPVSGRILRVPNKSERVVAAGEPLVEIGDPANLEIVVDLLSADAVKVEAGQRVIVERWGGDSALSGRVQRVEPFGFTKVSALGIEEQRVNVVIDFLSPAEQWQRLGHGYQVETRIVLWEGNDVLTVPLTALFRNGRDWALFVSNAGRAHLRLVEIGRRSGLAAEILSGLEPGDAIVVHPSNRVADGTRISDRG